MQISARRRRRKRQQGAVLVEGVMVGGCLVALLGCMLVVHRYCAGHIAKLDEAREVAWRKAMNGCGSEEPSLPDMALQIKAGDGPPFPLNFVPFILREERSFQVTGGPFAPSGRREMKFICNPAPVKTKPLTDMVGWLGDMFI